MSDEILKRQYLARERLYAEAQKLITEGHSVAEVSEALRTVTSTYILRERLQEKANAATGA